MPRLSFNVFLVWILFLFASAAPLFGQSAESTEVPPDRFSAGFSTSFLGSAGQLPFWMTANTYGLVRPGMQYQNLAGAWFETPLLSPGGRLQITAGSELAARMGDGNNTLHFRRLYGSVRYGQFRLSIGRFYDTRGIYMEPLTMGSMTMSRNITPFPKIKLETNGYIDVPATDGILQFQLNYSDGILEENRPVQSPYLHQKTLHLKVNIHSVEIIGGIDHNVVWGGERDDGLPRPTQSFSDYLRVVASRAGDENSGANEGEVLNRVGNTVASYDLGANYITDDLIIRAYRTFFIEDQPAARFRSPWDGVWGLGVERKEDKNGLFNAILYEHMNTIRQDGKGYAPEGRAGYYSHYLYKPGWTYHGNVIGNPLLTFDRETGRISNNMVIAHHLALQGAPSAHWNYSILATYSRNYGICQDRIVPGSSASCGGPATSPHVPNPDDFLMYPRSEFRQDQYSFLVNASFELFPSRGISLHGSLATDLGEYRGNLTGFMTGISWKID